MAAAEPRGGLDAASEGARPALAHSDRLPAQLRGTTGVENFCQETEDLGEVLTVTSQGPAEPPPEELVEAGGLQEDEQNKKSHFRKLDCCGDGYRKEEEEAEDAEEHRAECCALAPGESWSKQPLKFQLRTWQDFIAAKYKSLLDASLFPEENHVQVTAETLPKLTEEVQGMKADGTRIFSKAGYRSDGVSKGLPSVSNECPDVDTVMARAGVSETSTLDFLEPLKVMDIESAAEHPQETNEYNGLKARTAMPLRTGSHIVSILETREEKLPKRNPVNEFRTSVADCQSCQQDEENNTYDFCTGPVHKHNEPHRLSSVGSCGTLSTKSSEALCSVLKSICYVDFRNMPLENNSTAVHGLINEPPKKYLPKNTESQTHYDRGTGFVENPTSMSVAVEQVSVVRSEGLSSAKVDRREVSASIGKSYSSEFEEAAEVRRKIAVGDNVEVGSWPEAQEGANSEHCHSSVFSSVASSPEELSKEKLKIVLSEGDKLEKDQWQFPVGDLCKDNIKENSLIMEMSNIASHEIGQTDTCFCNTSSKSSPPSSYSSLDLSTKLEEDSPEAQLLEKESESKTSEELAGSLVEATEHNSNDSLSGGKETSLIYTLNVRLPPVAQKSREPHRNECPPCTANEVSSRDKARNNLSGKESIGASGTTQEQVTEIVLHKDKFKSSLCSRTFDNPKTTSKISQKNMKSSVGNRESVVTALVNEHGDAWNCNNQSIKEECTAAGASCILSGSTRVDDVLLNSHSFNVEVDEKIEENDNLEGEASVGYNSKKVIIFPEARFPLACGSLPCEGEWGNRGVGLHGLNDIFTAKSTFCSAHTAEKATATLVRDEISNKNVEVVKQFGLCKVTDGSGIVGDRDEAKEQTGMCALQADGFGKIRTVDSSKAPEGNHRNKSNEQLLVRYLKKETCVHNFGFCNSSLRPNKREPDAYKKKQVSSLAANPSEYIVSACGTCPLLNNTNIQPQCAGQTEETLHPMKNQCLACQSEFEGPATGNKQHLESLNSQAGTGLQTMATSGEETKISIGSSQSEEILIKTGDDLPLLVHKYAKGSFQGTQKENVVDLDSLNGVRNEDCSGYMGYISDLIEEKTVELKEHKNGCEREDKGTLEESFSGSKSHCSQHACFIKCAKGNAELLFAGNRMQPSLPKIKWLVEDQENTVSTQFLPVSSVHGSLSYKPENMNVLSETETKKSLRARSILNNSCPRLTFEPGKETDAHIGPSCFRKFDIQESFNETQADSERPSALNLGIALPEKEELWTSSENTQIDNCDSSSAKVFSKDSSVTKLSVTMSVKRKGSNIEIPSSENETKTSFLKGAKSSRVCARSKESLREEGHSMLTVKDMDVTSPKSAHCEEKFKDMSVEEKMGREVASRKKLPINSFIDGEDDCLRASLEDSKESGSKIVPLDTEVLEEIPRADLNNLSKERGNGTEFANLAGTSLLSEAVHDCQAEDASDAETSPKLQYNTTPTTYPHKSIFSNSCKESSPNCVVCSEACVPYKLHAQSKDNVKEVTEGQDTVPTRSACKENEALGSERLHEKDREKYQVLKQKKHKKMGARLSDKAQREQKSEYQEKAKITLQPRYDGIPGAFGTTNKLRGPLPLKRQPGRTCKKVPTSYQLKSTTDNGNGNSRAMCAYAKAEGQEVQFVEQLEI
ncbi:protein prr14l [Limosa lapponica baueri]|uniref:Protein prr14l n=1 Tax=Limosa lapponica baueri TaxID=1758121 RepID=A0A2I0TPP2_LIMLA|nr:protein prr14l [Limosa lapponica baueri]